MPNRESLMDLPLIRKRLCDWDNIILPKMRPISVPVQFKKILLSAHSPALLSVSISLACSTLGFSRRSLYLIHLLGSRPPPCQLVVQINTQFSRQNQPENLPLVAMVTGSAT